MNGVMSLVKEMTHTLWVLLQKRTPGVFDQLFIFAGFTPGVLGNWPYVFFSGKGPW